MHNSKENTPESLLQDQILPERIALLKTHNPIRQLKVQNKTIVIPGGVRFDTRHKDVPSLPLAGEWLRKAGFEAGKQVVIIPEQGKLIIKLV